MKVTFQIAKNELATLFYSTVAWVVLVLFVLHTGYLFSSSIADLAFKYQEGIELPDAIGAIFSTRNEPQGVLAAVSLSLYLYIPLLSMGLLSREMQSGSLKLLQSSPVTVIQIVLGKFLSMLMYGAVLIAILLIYLGLSVLLIHPIDIKHVLSGLIGITLLIATFSAVGLFMSSLTRFQIIAALGTLAMLFFLSYISSIGQKLPTIRDVTYRLRMNGRIDQFLDGLIITRNVFYFHILIILFLVLTMLRLSYMQVSKSWKIKAFAYSLSVVTGIIVIYTSAIPRFTGYLDLTEDQGQTLSKASQGIIKKLKKPLVIHTYVNVLSQFALFASPENRNRDKDFFEQYRRFIPDLKMDYTYYYDTPDNNNYPDYGRMSLKDLTQKVAPMLGYNFDELLSPQLIRKTFDPTKEDEHFVRLLVSGDQHTFLRTYDDFFVMPFETEIDNALKRLTAPTPKVAFLAANKERSIVQSGDSTYKFEVNQTNYRRSLINLGFDISNIDPKSQDIPDSLATLVIADPRISYSQYELAKIQRYVDRGRNLLIVGGPKDNNILQPVLNFLGVRLMSGRLIQRHRDYEPDLLLAKPSIQAEKIFPGLNKANTMISMPGSSEILITNTGAFHADTLLWADQTATWTGDQLSKRLVAKEKFDKKIITAISLTRHTKTLEQRIVVLGSADMLSQRELKDGHPNLNVANKGFIAEVFEWLDPSHFAVNIPAPADPKYTVLLTEKWASFLTMMILGVLPGIVILSGTILLKKRNRQ